MDRRTSALVHIGSGPMRGSYKIERSDVQSSFNLRWGAVSDSHERRSDRRESFEQTVIRSMAFERNRNWQKTCLICLENHPAFLRQVRLWQKYYKIPADSTFCLSEGDLPRKYLKGNYRPLQQGCLKDVDLKTQLIIWDHGNPSVVSSNDFGPSELADRLAYWGLKQVGLLSVRACAVGAGEYLENLKDNLVSKGIGVGWLIGYRGV
jgi:hypothetical protein